MEATRRSLGRIVTNVKPVGSVEVGLMRVWLGVGSGDVEAEGSFKVVTEEFFTSLSTTTRVLQKSHFSTI